MVSRSIGRQQPGSSLTSNSRTVCYNGFMSNPKHQITPISLQAAIKDGHYAKVIKAIKAGQDIHAPLPTRAGVPAHRAEKPALLAHMWRWEKPERALQVMGMLLEAGADPNEPDSVGRRPLHTWLWLADAPKEAIQALVKAGANPLYKSVITPNGQEHQSALQVCVFHGKGEKAEWITEVVPDIGLRHDDHWEEPIMRNAIQNTRDDTPQNRKLLLDLLESGASIDAVDKFGRSGRNEIMGYQAALVSSWEDIVRAKHEGQALDADTPRTPAKPGKRRI